MQGKLSALAWDDPHNKVSVCLFVSKGQIIDGTKISPRRGRLRMIFRKISDYWRLGIIAKLWAVRSDMQGVGSTYNHRLLKKFW